MTQYAGALTSAEVGTFEAYSSVSSRVLPRLNISAPTREIILLGITMAVIQIMDGVLTGIGVSHYGTAAEGNIFIRFLMEQFGFIPALFLAKGLAICVTISLCMLSSLVSWLPRAMKLIIGVYVFAAIIPWSAVLLHKFV